MPERRPDHTLVQTYISHGDEWFFVSTIDRDSSAMLGPDRFAETIVWHLPDGRRGANGEQLWMGSAYQGSIREHQRIVDAIRAKGREAFKEKDDDA